MSILGGIFFILLIAIFSLLLKNKFKIGMMLFLLYLTMLPFMLYLPQTFSVLLGDKAGMIVLILLPFIALVCGSTLYLLKKQKNNKDNPIIIFLKSKRLKSIICATLFLIMIYIEFFNGIESFDDKGRFFDYKTKIGIGHFFPYSLTQMKDYKNVNNAYYGCIPFFESKHLYLYNNVLYYCPEYYSTYYFDYDEAPPQHWVKWGQKYDFRPD